MSLVIGLTGGIATGKSTVSCFLAQHRYQIVDADRITHAVQARGSQGLAAIILGFGDGLLTADRTLNRRKLGNLVFHSPAALKKLVRIIDPFIRRRVIREITGYRHRGARRIVLDAPTLFENGYQYLADRIVTVACSPRLQLQRLINRDHLSISSAESRMASQWPLTIKERLSDLVINSNGTIDQTRAQVIKLMHSHRL